MKLVFLFFPLIVYGKSFYVTSELDTVNGYIGDVIKWTIKIENSQGKSIRFPDLKTNNSNILIKSQKFLYDNSTDILNGVEFEIMVWDTGKYVTPDYSLEILSDNGNIERFLDLEPINFQIASILLDQKETNYKNMKGPVRVKSVFPILEILSWISIGLIFLTIVWIWGKREKPYFKKINYRISETPFEQASRRLDKLDTTLLKKEYYTKLSHIIREYVERKYFIRTLEMTTKEIEENVDIFQINQNSFLEMVKFLYDADYVKYAREIPDENKMIEDKKKIELLINDI